MRTSFVFDSGYFACLAADRGAENIVARLQQAEGRRYVSILVFIAIDKQLFHSNSFAPSVSVLLNVFNCFL